MGDEIDFLRDVLCCACLCKICCEANSGGSSGSSSNGRDDDMVIAVSEISFRWFPEWRDYPDLDSRPGYLEKIVQKWRNKLRVGQRIKVNNPPLGKGTVKGIVIQRLEGKQTQILLVCVMDSPMSSKYSKIGLDVETANGFWRGSRTGIMIPEKDQEGRMFIVALDEDGLCCWRGWKLIKLKPNLSTIETPVVPGMTRYSTLKY